MTGVESSAELPTSEWVTVRRPGYFGRHRDERYREFDEQYGKGNWRIAWESEGRALEFREVCAEYEDAYFEFFRANLPVLRRLVLEASDVYDDAPSNTRSGTDYGIQETNRTHIQDIAIRRCVERMGTRFMGDRLIQIRAAEGDHPLSLTLSPGHVPFHRPDEIKRPELEGWWDAGSVESFYQSNKVLQVKHPEVRA